MRNVAIVLACLVLSSLACSAANSADRPNVLFIAVDDMNDWIGCLGGHPQALTPNMDRLAARGVLFANAHCAAPACNPSRAAIFSGRMPQTSGVWSNNSGSLEKEYPQARLLSTAFSEAGFETLGTGKLLHKGGKESFDEYYSVEQRWSPLPRDAVDYTDEELPTKRTSNPRHVVSHKGKTYTLPLNRMPSDRRPNQAGGESFDWGPFDVPDSEFGDTQITDWAIEKLQKGFDKPFFMGVGYYRPHIPLWAPKRFFDRFATSPGQLPPIKTNDLDDLSEIGRKWAIEAVTAGSHATVVKYDQWQKAIEAYLACITYVDHEVGRLLDALDNSPFAENTVIVLWSDHGWHLGEKEHWGKWTGWERSTKVTLMVAPPRNQAGDFAAAGARCDQPVGLIDLYPTLVEFCGAKGPQELDGESLVPLLREPNNRTGRGLVTMFDKGNGSIRTDRWRYIHYADGSEELYDLKNDPNEWINLAGSGQRTAQMASLRKMMQPYLESSGSK